MAGRQNLHRVSAANRFFPSQPSEEHPDPMRFFVFVAILATVSLAPADAADFDPRIVTFGDTREQIKSTPITERPNRPLHVYGNTVRRRQSRDSAGPRASSSRR
jgi:hypothetical protein